MTSLSEATMRALMSKPNNIRNMSIIAHVDHGKTTLTDSLVQLAGIISEHRAGNQRFTDTRADEQERCITIKSTAISMYYKVEETELKKMNVVNDGTEFLINLIDSPGHVDFSSEVTAALRVTDGAVVVVSNAAGVCVQTKTVLQQALSELVKPILFINKLDSSFSQGASSEEIYQQINKAIENVNVIIATGTEETGPLGVCTVDPLKGSVVFGSGLNCWAFRISDLADMLTAKKFALKGEPIDRGSEKFIKASTAFASILWGEYYYDEETTKIVNKPGENRNRTFNYFILDIIKQVFKAETDTVKIQELIRRLQHDYVVPTEASNKTKQEVFRICMKSFLPAGTSLLSSIVKHLPSPKTSQMYREALLYTGDHNDASATAIRNCDPNGPLIVYVSKMVPSGESNRFFAMARVFSGTINTSMKVRIFSATYDPNNKDKSKDVYENKNVKRVCILLASKTVNTTDIPCGNICALIGIDDWLVRSGTIATAPDACPIRTMKFSVSAILQRVIWPKNKSDLTKLIEGLKSMVKADPIVSYKSIEDGKYVISGTGEMHLEICLKDLEEMYAKGVELCLGQPIVEYRETVVPMDSHKDYQLVIAKCSHGHNKIHMNVCSLSNKCMEGIEAGTIHLKMTVKERSREIIACGVHADLTSDIWKFAPEQATLTQYGANFLNNYSSSVAYLNECKDGIVKGFEEAITKGPLSGSELRGVIFNLVDADFHSDSTHRNSAIISQACKKACIGTLLHNGARIVEPWFQLEIEHPNSQQNNVNKVIEQRKGKVFETQERTNSSMVTLAHISVKKSLDLLTSFRKETGGTAFPSCSFSHWEIIDEDPYETPISNDYTTNAAAIIREMRERRGMNLRIPVATDFYDLALTKAKMR